MGLGLGLQGYRVRVRVRVRVRSEGARRGWLIGQDICSQCMSIDQSVHNFSRTMSSNSNKLFVKIKICGSLDGFNNRDSH